MNMAERVMATETEVEQVTKGELMEDLRAVVAGAEELLKATADADRGADRCGARQGGGIAEGSQGLAQRAGCRRDGKNEGDRQGHRRLREDNPWKAMESPRALVSSSGSWPRAVESCQWSSGDGFWDRLV